jgi:hypothetical protein
LTRNVIDDDCAFTELVVIEPVDAVCLDIGLQTVGCNRASCDDVTVGRSSEAARVVAAIRRSA